MKKNLLFKSGISLLILAGSSIGPVSAGTWDEGGMYSELQGIQHLQQWTPNAVRGAEGPIRSMDVQPAAAEGGIYTSLSQYQIAQQFNMTPDERGAQGRAASDYDMAAARSEQEWRQMVGIFYGSD